MKIGDLVRLKSGGPIMSVVAIGEKGWIHCRWFVADESRKDAFPPEVLEMAEQPAAAK